MYAAIKAALQSVARTWESELRGRKIRVSVIGSGSTETLRHRHTRSLNRNSTTSPSASHSLRPAIQASS